MNATRSAIAWSFFGPPPATPHACIGVPGRPYVMMSVTSQIGVGWPVAWLARAQSGPRLNRSASVLSGGAFQLTFTPLTRDGATPPSPLSPWQFAHCSDDGGVVLGLCRAARTAPRRGATAFLSKYVVDWCWRVGSRSQ